MDQKKSAPKFLVCCDGIAEQLVQNPNHEEGVVSSVGWALLDTQLGVTLLMWETPLDVPSSLGNSVTVILFV